MRILFVIDGLGGGGAEKATLRLAGHLGQSGHSVAIASLLDNRSYPIPHDVQFLACHYPSGRQRWPTMGKTGRHARRHAQRLEQLLAEHLPCDLVVSTLMPADRIVGQTSFADVAWYRIPTTLSEELVSQHPAMKRFRRRRRIRRTYDGKKIIGISNGVLEDLTGILGVRPSTAVRIYNPKDYLVHVGRFVPAKRHDRLIAAFAKSDFPGRLVLLGTGSDSQIARVRGFAESAGVGERVQLAGFQGNPYPYIAGARALVVSSDFEGLANVIIEALVCGTPVVSTRCPSGPEEILTEDLAIGLADLNEESLATAIDRVLRDPPVIRPEHLSRFDIEKIAQQYLALARR
jgi:glycosyltransferase involved in cell wall biosynthesis